jgi:hypothetical protein
MVFIRISQKQKTCRHGKRMKVIAGKIHEVVEILDWPGIFLMS